MTAKTSISPSPHETTAGPDASSPPSASGSVHSLATHPECQRPRSPSTQKRSSRPGPQVVAASPLGGRGVPRDSVVVMASDDTGSDALKLALRSGGHGAGATAGGPPIGVDRRID